jgi:arginine-tRNA-protein transferase
MKFGISRPFTCSYLAEKDEQLLVFIPSENGEHSVKASIHEYDLLIGAGFRRSGFQIYRPHCPSCKACESIRVPINKFKPSKSQKRVINRNKDLSIHISYHDKPEYYPLYERYINTRHADGTMYPASREQYDGFILSPWQKAIFIEFRLEQTLLAVAVTDDLPNSLSALYTFFDPNQEKRSFGTFAILQQIDLCKKLDKGFLYLGYQIDACSKMSYKQKFLPHERFFEEKWQLITKKTG